MAQWKKVLVSGSQIEVAGITASAIPSSGGFEDRVVVFDNSGVFKSVKQSEIQGVTTAQFTVKGTTGTDTFDATSDTLIVTGSVINVSASADTNETTLTLSFTDNVVSSSAQLATEISGAINDATQSLSASLSTDLTSIISASDAADSTIAIIQSSSGATATLLKNSSLVEKKFSDLPYMKFS